MASTPCSASPCSAATGLSDAERIERDVYLYRSYIELGTYDVRTHACCRLAAAPAQLTDAAACTWWLAPLAMCKALPRVPWRYLPPQDDRISSRLAHLFVCRSW